MTKKKLDMILVAAFFGIALALTVIIMILFSMMVGCSDDSDGDSIFHLGSDFCFFGKAHRTVYRPTTIQSAHIEPQGSGDFE